MIILLNSSNCQILFHGTPEAVLINPLMKYLIKDVNLTSNFLTKSKV
jgi:hypothetical protein